MTPRLELKHTMPMSSAGLSVMMELTHQQALVLVEELVADVVAGRIEEVMAGSTEKGKGKGRRPGNFMATAEFGNRGKDVSQRDAADLEPEFAIKENEDRELVVENGVESVHAKIVASLSALKRDAPVELSQIFSKRLLNSLEWTAETRQKILEYLAKLQADFLLDITDRFKIKPQTQADVAEKMGIAASSVSRLMKNLKITLPNGEVCPAGFLIPGPYYDGIRIQHGLELLKGDKEVYSRKYGWRLSGERLAWLLEDRFGLQYKDRTVRKHLLEMGDPRDHDETGELKAEIVAEVDELLEGYANDPEFFNQKTGRWKNPTARLSLQQRISQRNRIVIPIDWVWARKFEKLTDQNKEELWKKVRFRWQREK